MNLDQKKEKIMMKDTWLTVNQDNIQKFHLNLQLENIIN